MRWSHRPVSGSCHSQDRSTIPLIICACSIRRLVEKVALCATGCIHSGPGPAKTSRLEGVHVKCYPKGRAFDRVVVDEGPGVRATPERNPGPPNLESGRGALRLGVQDLVWRHPNRDRRSLEGPYRDAATRTRAMDPFRNRAGLLRIRGAGGVREPSSQSREAGRHLGENGHSGLNRAWDQ